MTRIKVLFLDFDGVLNSHTFARRVPQSGVMGLDPEAVARVNRIIAETGAEVVVSSTWRIGRSRTQLCDILSAVGFTGTVRGCTPENVRISGSALFAGERRGHEIQAWLDAAPRYGLDVTAFAILDDDNDMAHLAPRLVRTTFADGLQDEHVGQAVRLLFQETETP